MRRIAAVAWLEAMALLLAASQALIGVRTDEAKYLLNIPYPHPPLLRYVIGLTDGLPFQDLLWRIIFASVLVQAVWIVRDIASDVDAAIRHALMAAWVSSTAVLLQAGTVMLVVPTALFGLLFLWLLIRPDRCSRSGIVGLLWLAALFVALQNVLFAPLVWEVLRRRLGHPLERITIVVVPVFLLLLSIATNPLSIASIAGIGGDVAHADWYARWESFAWVWLIGGGAIGSVVGTVGLIRFPRWPILFSFALIAMYVLVSHGHAYYALLFLPFFIAGFHTLSIARPTWVPHAPVIVCASMIFASFVVRMQPVSAAPAVATMLARYAHIDRVMIDGPFGHEWQYALHADVRRFTTGLLPVTDAVVCTADCPAMHSWEGEWDMVNSAPEVWVRRRQ